jgi:hypothetical protein
MFAATLGDILHGLGGMPKNSGIPFAIGESTIDLHKFSVTVGVCVTLSLADGDIGIAINLLFPSNLLPSCLNC